MSGILNTGKLAKLLSRLTAVRAALLDNLDSAVSSCTQSSVWTATKAGYLDQAISSIQAGLPVPTSLSTPTTNDSLSGESWGCGFTQVDNGAVQSTYSTLISDTGEGVLQFIKVSCIETGGSATDDMQAKLVLNGVTVWESASDVLAEDYGWIVVGAEEDDEASAGSTGVALEALRYTSGFSLQVKNNSSTSQYAFRIVYKYYTTD